MCILSHFIDVTTQDGVAIAGSDFEETNEQFIIEAGSSVNLTVHNNQSEPPETFSMVMYNKDGDLIRHTVNNSANVVVAPDLQCGGKIEYGSICGTDCMLNRADNSCCGACFI